MLPKSILNLVEKHRSNLVCQLTNASNGDKVKGNYRDVSIVEAAEIILFYKSILNGDLTKAKRLWGDFDTLTRDYVIPAKVGDFIVDIGG